jgi:hypothetical protein
MDKRQLAEQGKKVLARLRPLAEVAAPKIPRFWKRLLKNPIVVVSAATFGVRIGKDAYAMKKGEIDAPEFRARTGSHLGSISGGVFGAAAGAAAFSVIPGVGTVLGAFAGGLLGESVGGKLGRKSAEHVETMFWPKTESAKKRSM